MTSRNKETVTSSLSLKEDDSKSASLLAEEKCHVTLNISPLSRLRYRLTEIPPPPMLLFIALQHVLLSLASSLTMSSVVSDILCSHPSHPVRAHLFSTTLFMSGLCTIMQTFFGVRLPVFQGPSSSFLVPLLALSKNPLWVCSSDVLPVSNNGVLNYTLVESNATALSSTTAKLSLEEKLQQLSGSLMVASLLEVLIGAGGLIRPLLRYIGPITVAPSIALIGLSLFKLPVIYGKINPALALASAMLVLIFALYLAKVNIPIPCWRKEKVRTSVPVFQLLPILLALVVMWIVSAILTAAGAFSDDPRDDSFYSRSDAKNDIIRNTPWLQFVYPGQFGPPSFSLAAMIGFLGAVMASVVESVGDYFAVSRTCEVPVPPDHAISRGIMMEGLGSVLSGAVGSAHATTSYSGNIALITLTKTASRSVMLVAGALLILVSLLGKAGAIFASLPPPILGGMLLVLLGLLGALGLSSLKFVDMSSNRNLLIIGVSFMCGLSIPAFVEEHGDMLATGNENVDQIIHVVLGTPMFLGGLTALVLDNTVSGTSEERGLSKWKQSHSPGGNDVSSVVSKPGASKCQSETADTSPGLAFGESLTEEETYSFRCFRGKHLPRWLRFLPFLPAASARAVTLESDV